MCFLEETAFALEKSTVAIPQSVGEVLRMKESDFSGRQPTEHWQCVMSSAVREHQRFRAINGQVHLH